MTFDYHRSLGPIVGVVLALSLVETCALHVVAMACWGWRIALILGLADISLVIMLGTLLHSFRVRPILLADGVLTMRTGYRLILQIPLSQIESFRDHWSSDDLKAPTVSNMALAAWPNVMLDLKLPIVRRRKAIISVAHCVDDPAAFRIAVQAAALNASRSASDR